MSKADDVPISKLVDELSKELKKIDAVKPPEWASFVRTGGDKEKQPEDKDWWYVRSASILRKTHIYGPVGTHALRKIYGGKKNRGHNPEARRRGSGAVIRNILQQLEKAGLIKKTKEGRVPTSNGVSLLGKVSHQIRKNTPELSKYR